jgi:hypothetical protein
VVVGGAVTAEGGIWMCFDGAICTLTEPCKRRTRGYTMMVMVIQRIRVGCSCRRSHHDWGSSIKGEGQAHRDVTPTKYEPQHQKH